MEGFEGALQSDAHSGYGALATKNLLRLGCMMHYRRLFEEAYVVGKKQPGLAADGLAMLRWVYDREEEYKKGAFIRTEFVLVATVLNFTLENRGYFSP